MATNTAGNVGRDYHKQLVHYLRKTVTYADEGTEIVVGYLPANACVVGGTTFITTAFDDTSTIDVGFKDGSTTDDPNAYVTAGVLTTALPLAFDEVNAATNKMQTTGCTVTCQVNDGSGMVSAGSAEVIVEYVCDNDG